MSAVQHDEPVDHQDPADTSAIAETSTTSLDVLATPVVDFDTHPSRYRHWTLAADGAVATVTLRVDENGGLVPGYELKRNSYDLGVDIELYDAVQLLSIPRSRPS
jgi:benzoyl-CoA-dihydrodiol lyase